ncbi:MAG: hypothetical protein KIT84_12700 [Labilithrix sp.]|nr:hypothetical protein [Labilithrix sp.]MCW5811874.1 hypothetical protein [Labilithrix sp.]
MAAAAPPAGADKTEKVAGQRMMAQADQPLNQQATDPASGGSNAPSPSGAPGGPAQPAVTVGTPAPDSSGAPTSDTPQAAAAAAAPKPKPRPFAGSSLFLQQSMTTNTVFRGQTQYANPTIETAAIIGPRFAITPALQLRARLVASYEWTNNDGNTYAHEPVLSDTTLQLFYRKIPSFAGIMPNLALSVGLPTSKGSRARTLVAAPGAMLQLVRGFENVLGGDLMLLSNFTYTHPLYTSRQPVTIDDRPYALQCVGGSGCTDLLSGMMNISDTLSYSLIVVQEWGHFSPGLAYIGGSQWAYRPPQTVNPVDGTLLAQNSDATNVRQSHYFAAWLDYNFASWITGEIGYYAATAGIGLSGTRSNPIFERYQDTRVYLGASIQLDNLVKALQGSDNGEAGVIRAKNNKAPIMTF